MKRELPYDKQHLWRYEYDFIDNCRCEAVAHNILKGFYVS